MADIVITSLSQVSSTTNVSPKRLLFETVTEGQVAYADPTNNQYGVADCETSLVTAGAVGLYLGGGVATNYVGVLTRGLVGIGGTTLVEDEEYFLSTAGLLMPYADLATGDWIVSIGFAKTTTQLDVWIRNLKKQKA